MTNKLYNPELGDLNDFKNFLYLAWQAIPDIKGKVPTPLQYDIADFLQHSDDPFTIIMAYRGVGKSYITAAFVCWLWLINPEFKILVISASEKKAKEFAALVRGLINGMDILNHLAPQKGQRDSVLSFDVGPAGISKDPSLNVSGITGQITGGRADFIIPDDIEVPDNSKTVDMRMKLREKFQEVMAIIKPAIGGYQTQIKVLGTPQTEQSIYFAIENEGFKIRVWPARFPTEPEKYKGRLAPFITNQMRDDPKVIGQVTNPLMHDEADQRRRALGKKAWYQLQYMLDPSLADADRYPLKLRDFIFMNVDPEIAPVRMAWGDDKRLRVDDPEVPVVGLNGDLWNRPFNVSDTWKPYSQKLMAIDPAGGKDDTAYVVLYYLMGYIYIAEWGGFKGYGSATMESLSKIAAAHGVHEVLVEKNMGHGTFTELFKSYLYRFHKCAVEEVYVNTQKEVRICDTLEPVLAAHRLVISKKVVQKDYENPDQETQGLYQLTHITRDRGALPKDDRIDVLALGVMRLQEQLQEDVENTEEKLREEREDEHLRRFMEMASRGQHRADDRGSWLNLDGDGSESIEEDLMGERPWWELGRDD